MITVEHLKIYFSYKGDGDGFVRLATSREKAIMNYKNWSLIDSFIQDILIVNRGLAAKSYSKNLEERLKLNCDSGATIQELKNIASLLA